MYRQQNWFSGIAEEITTTTTFVMLLIRHKSTVADLSVTFEMHFNNTMMMMMMMMMITIIMCRSRSGKYLY